MSRSNPGEEKTPYQNRLDALTNHIELLRRANVENPRTTLLRDFIESILESKFLNIPDVLRSTLTGYTKEFDNKSEDEIIHAINGVTRELTRELSMFAEYIARHLYPDNPDKFFDNLARDLNYHDPNIEKGRFGAEYAEMTGDERPVRRGINLRWDPDQPGVVILGEEGDESQRNQGGAPRIAVDDTEEVGGAPAADEIEHADLDLMRRFVLGLLSVINQGGVALDPDFVRRVNDIARNAGVNYEDIEGGESTDDEIPGLINSPDSTDEEIDGENNPTPDSNPENPRDASDRSGDGPIR